MKLVPRVVGLFVLAGCGALLWLFVVSPVAEWKGEQFAELQGLRADEARLERSLETLRDELVVLSGDGEVSFVWRSPQIGTATAEVQSALNTLASSTGISLRSITPLPAAQDNSRSTIAFRIESEAALDTLTDFLVALEYGERALVVRSATLRRLARPANEQIQPVVFFQMDVVAPVVLTAEVNP